jgi:predicted unusual protein kinase regulating ubiquinone biosynthesis (AarF/ABC1/UbiB family)
MVGVMMVAARTLAMVELRRMLAQILRLVELAYIWIPVFFVMLKDGRNSRSVIDQVRKRMQRSGPVFVKFGQWVATRSDCFSAEVCTILGSLHTHVDISGPSDAEFSAARRLCAIARIDPTAIGGGCIARVYRATLMDGRVVALKCRRKNVDGKIAIDIDLLVIIAKIAEFFYSDLKWLSLGDGITFFTSFMRRQTDLRLEAEHLRRFRENFGVGSEVDVRIPDVYYDSEDVLVMEFVHGIPLADFIQNDAKEEDKRAVWRILSIMVGKMVLLHNFVHQDMHPGNIMVSMREGAGGCASGCRSMTNKISLTLIDAGMALDVKAQRRSFFFRMFSEGLRADPERAGDTFLSLHKDLGYATDVVLEKNFVRKIGALVVCAIYPRSDLADEAFGSKELSDEARLPQIFALLINVFKNHQVVMDPEIWSVFSTLSIVEMSLRALFNGNILENVVPLMGLKFAKDVKAGVVPCFPMGRSAAVSDPSLRSKQASESSCSSGVLSCLNSLRDGLFASSRAEGGFSGQAALDNAADETSRKSL